LNFDPCPWEHLLWTARPFRLFARLSGEQYRLTDFRLVRSRGTAIDELVLHDIGEVRRIVSRVDRLLGTSTLVVRARGRNPRIIVLAGIRKGTQVAALIEFLSGDPSARLDGDAVRAALAWTPRLQPAAYREAITALLILIALMAAVVIGPSGNAAPVIYAADDPIVPNGAKRDRQAIVRYMEQEVMPWARATLGPLKGGPDRVTCETCHGTQPAAHAWQMPGVAALPESDVAQRGWEVYGTMNSEMRNAIYGYLAESDKQARATYMRAVVMPGMAGLLHRPAYDFTKSYDYNRSRHALGCYHCHRVK
jgi:hypothetical protein